MQAHDCYQVAELCSSTVQAERQFSSKHPRSKLTIVSPVRFVSLDCCLG